MKIAIPTRGDRGLDEQISGHFGRAPTFTIWDSESEGLRVIQNRGKHMGGAESPPNILAKEEVSLLICSGLGPKAFNRLGELGIQIMIGAEGTVADTLRMWKEGKLKEADFESACANHLH